MASDGGVEPEKKNKLKLYSYFRSSCSQRVRTALSLKGIEYEYKAVNLLKGENFSPEFTKLNPLGFVPVLVDEEIVISDSFAILMYLEEKYPQNPLLPRDLQRRAINYQAANIVSSSIQPYQNLSTQKYLEAKFNSEEMLTWVRFHLGKGFAALEKVLQNFAGKYATGDEVYLETFGIGRLWKVWFLSAKVPNYQSLLQMPLSPDVKKVLNPADLFLAPQLHAGINRFNVDMSQLPILSRLHEAYKEHPAFQEAAPENQPDAPAQLKT